MYAIQFSFPSLTFARNPRFSLKNRQMAKGIFEIPIAFNEPVKDYAPGSPEREELQKAYDDLWNSKTEIPMVIGGERITTDDHQRVKSPQDHGRDIGFYHYGKASHVKDAIAASLAAKEKWEAMPWEHRAAIFLKAADLIAGPYRARLNAATMIGQGKNAFQAEIDAACELIDFLRFNVQYMAEIYRNQPESGEGVWNRLEYRALEGFTFAITPFNFTAIAGNLSTSMAMMGNTVVWKPSLSQIYSAHVLMEIFEKAGVPDGVINMIFTDPQETADIVFNHKDFAGLHYTGSTTVFQDIWKTIGNNIKKYKTYPRIVGETGGKDFVLAHPSADAAEVATGLVRGAFEYQGQKCSAASRAYIPESLWEDVKKQVLEDLDSIEMGTPRDFTNFINAVIHEGSFDKLAKFVDGAKEDSNAEIIAGGGYDKSTGYFVEPTVIVAKDPKYVTMCEELFGPVLTLYIFDDADYDKTVELVDETSIYGLTGCIFSGDRAVIADTMDKLRYAAGNFYINDKPTGAVVGQQPFGGGRASGTNDKAGSMLNLLRWVSPRAIKETFVPATDYRYPFLGED